MYVLIDWDNIEDSLRRQGPRYISDRIWGVLQKSMPHHVRDKDRLNVRLYGGWYGPTTLTPYGTEMAAKVQSDFPFVLRNSAQQSRVTINCELAHALLCLPKQTLTHTFRTRSRPRITCKHPTTVGCAETHCPTAIVHQFFSSGACSASQCSLRLEEFLTGNEQKLVDTMLVSDIIHLAVSREPCISVVSSDDDLWPGMLMAMDQGSQVLQLCTKYPSTYRLYHGMLSGRYSHSRL